MTESDVDYREKIIADLQVLQQKENLERNFFKARAYKKVVDELLLRDTPIRTMDDVRMIPGVGEKIRAKIEEILSTGELRVAQEIKADKKRTIQQQLLDIYGVGPVKAKSLVADYGIQTVDDLKKVVTEHPDVLNAKQKIGLEYYEELQERIPRKEMQKHESLLRKFAVQCGFDMVMVGSYRRGKKDSGDIDILLRTGKGPQQEPVEKAFERMIKTLEGKAYIREILALGPKKCMAIVKLTDVTVARRLDILLTPEEEFPYALLYFTGSQKFNIATRKAALEKGYTMNEHGMKATKDGVDAPPIFKDEEAILNFLGMAYVKPEDRE